MNKILKVIFAVLLITLGILFRTAWHIAPNVEFVTSASLLAAHYLGIFSAFLVPLLIMVISDKIIGNTNIYLFTWSAYVIIALGGRLIDRKINGQRKISFKILKMTGIGIGASLFFFFYTNFGVWYLDNWGMYRRDLTGLLHSYVMGLPFLKLNLLGNLVFVPLSFLLLEFLLKAKYNLHWQIIQRLNRMVQTKYNYFHGRSVFKQSVSDSFTLRFFGKRENKGN